MTLASCRLLAKCTLTLLFVVFCSSAIVLWDSNYGWHNQQRIAQLALVSAFSVAVVFLPQPALSRKVLALLVGIFILGFSSALLAQWPGWALKEWARYLGLALLVLSVGGLAQHSRYRELALWGLAFVGCIHAFQFLVSYSAAFISGVRVLSADLLFNGFSNPRFFGQFQVMLLPVLALLLVRCWQQQLNKVVALLLLVMAVQWCVAIILGGRGFFLGLLVSHIFLVLINRSFWRFFALQVTAAVLGLLTYFLLFKLVPYWLELEPMLRDELRTSLSARELIWQWAWDMALTNPWLGAGPMHFSATYNSIAAHPHQVILQWLAEWGFAATALALVLGVWGIISGAVFLQRAQADVLDAGLWVAIVGALVLAQVDGVFVMPYTETWLAILIGLALARWSAVAPAKPPRRIFSICLALPVVIILGQVLVKDVPILPQREKSYMKQYGADWAPRFWQQGWISRDINRDISD